jgi:histidine triad (HIT) family protein
VVSDALTDCDFCRIARGEDASAEILWQEDKWVAFFPLEPATPGHTLIVPTVHVPTLWEADLDLAAELMKAVVLVGRAIQDAAAPDGMNLITSAGAVAEQTVFHLHLHVVPRWSGDGFGAIWPRENRYEDPERLEGLAERIRDAFARLAD